MNTGAEAVETAIKVSRKWGYDVKGVPADTAEIIVASGNFHGRTTTIVGFSDDPEARGGFGPFTPGFVQVPYGDLAALEAAITPHTVAVLIEPIQGEGGVVIPPDGYLRGIREVCTANNVLFAADEIQAGLGRTGKTFACDHEGVVPDIYILGKALGGGIVPVSAVVADRDVLDVLQPGQHGSTFGGNPLACAIARMALKVLVEEGMVENSATQGAYFKAQLEGIRSNVVKEVRGRGLMLAVELHPEAGGARRYCDALKGKGVLAKDTHEHSIRIAPPLVVTRDQIDWALERFESVLTGTAA
jgi:ornithine--oxo-acid transaminase